MHKCEAVLRNLAKLQQDTFYHELLGYDINEPVVLRKPMYMHPISFHWLHNFAEASNTEIAVQNRRNSSSEYEKNKLSHVGSMRFLDFVNQVMSPGNDVYLTANNNLLSNPAMDGLYQRIKEANWYQHYPIRSITKQNALVWIGAQGSRTPLHHDTVMLLHHQFFGAKRWRLISPLDTPRVYNRQGVFSEITDLDNVDYERFPDFRGVKITDLTVRAGETLFLPLGWWHQVDCVEGPSMSVSFTDLSIVDDPYQFFHETVDKYD